MDHSKIQSGWMNKKTKGICTVSYKRLISALKTETD